jgi:hypothetical protein
MPNKPLESKDRYIYSISDLIIWYQLFVKIKDKGKIARSFLNRDGLSLWTVGLKFHPLEETNAFDECLEKPLHTTTFDETHAQWMEAKPHIVFESIDNNPPKMLCPVKS